jgi:Rieske Fe-S protein
MSADAISRRTVTMGLVAPLLVCGWKETAKAAGYGDVHVAQWGEPVDIGDVAPGQWGHFEVDGSPVFVRHLMPNEIKDKIVQRKAESGAWIVLSGTCTHAGCRLLQGLGRDGGFMCPCHGSEFSIYGKMVRGPAREDLPTVPCSIENAKITFLEHRPGQG